MRKGRWHGAAVTEGSIRLDVLTKPGSTGKLVRSLSQPGADSSLYAREPPHPSRATPGPPSPEGKAASGGGLPSTCYVAYRVFLQGILPQAVTQLWKGAVRKVDIHKKFPQLFYKLWRNFLGFPGGSGGRAGERGGQFASFCFFSSYIQVYPQSFPGFPQNLSTAVDTAVDKFKSLFEITCSGRHRWLRHPSYRHPWPG